MCLVSIDTVHCKLNLDHADLRKNGSSEESTLRLEQCQVLDRWSNVVTVRRPLRTRCTVTLI